MVVNGGKNMPYPPKQDPCTNYTEEDCVVVSKGDLCMVWAGAKVLYSGEFLSGDQGYTDSSGYNYLSGDVDISPISYSGWGYIRIPEFSEIHKMFVTPKMPCIQAAVNWIGGNCSGAAKSGIGGVSGNVALVNYCDTCAGALDHVLSGDVCWHSGQSMISGVVDVIAFGSIY